MGSESLFERLNCLAKRRKESTASDTSPELHSFKKVETEGWSAKCESLITQLGAIEDDAERIQWFKKVLGELLMMVLDKEFGSGGLSLQNVADFIDSLGKVPPTDSKVETVSIIGKLYVAITSYIPGVVPNSEAETQVIELTKLVTSIHGEVYKFSALTSKINTKEQNVLLRHLLKKNKFELQKFNLLSESPVGFAQLTTLFVSFYSDNSRLAKLDYYTNEMYFIMGKFSLELIKSMDIFLGISAKYLYTNYSDMVAFLKATNFVRLGGPDTKNLALTNLLVVNLNEYDGELRESFWQICTILVQAGIVDADLVWHNLSPATESLEESLAKVETYLEKESTKGTDNPLAMAAALSAEDEDKDANMDAANKETAKDTGNDAETGTLENQESASMETLTSSGKIQFIRYLLIFGCWDDVYKLLRTYPKILYLDNDIPRLIARLLEVMITPLYEKTPFFLGTNGIRENLMITKSENGLLSHKPRLYTTSQTGDPFAGTELNVEMQFFFKEWSEGIPKCGTVDALFERSHEYLTVAGPKVAQSPSFVSKLCRIGIHDIETSQLKEESTDRWIDYVRKFLLPMTSTEFSNSIVTSELFSLMTLFPVERRYFMYNEMITKLSQDNILVKIGFNKAARDAKSILKSLSTDTISKESRNLSKVISCNPLATLTPTVKQVENYDKVSELIIYTTRYFNDFAFDVLQYILLLSLTKPRSSVQSDGVNQAAWVNRLAIFIAGLKKHGSKMDITNIIVYVTKTLHEGNIIAVSILKQLIITVGGIRDLNEVNVKTLIMLNSGSVLKSEARKSIFDHRESNVDNARRLIDLFKSENGVSEIMLLLYNLNLKSNTNDAHYKVLSSRSDEMKTLLWSFVELVKHCCKNGEFVRNVLSFPDLISKFHVSTPWAFHIWRDYMDEKINSRSKEDSNHSSSLDTIENIMNETQFENVDFTHLSRDLFITFWQLSLYDIKFEKGLYDEMKSTMEEDKKLKNGSRKPFSSGKLKRLLTSCIEHQKTFTRTRELLGQKSESWCQEFESAQILPFLQFALIPRALFSPPDAIYSATFVASAFQLESGMRLLDTLINSNVISALLFSCTVIEAGNLGIFFCSLFEWLEEQRAADGVFSSDQRRQLYDWHCSMTAQIIDLLSAKNYMSIRNGIEFMKYVSRVFPVVRDHVELLCGLLESNLVSEEREDIILPTSALLGHLKARLRKSAIALSDFCEMTPEEQLEAQKYAEEVKEIEEYDKMIKNEEKQEEIKRKLQENKLRREQTVQTVPTAHNDEEQSVEESATAAGQKKEAPARVPTGPSVASLQGTPPVGSASERAPPSGTVWSLNKLLACMEDVAYHVQANNVEKALKYIPDEQMQRDIRSLTRRTTLPLPDFRNSLYKLLSEYFESLIYYPKNPDFQRLLSNVRNGVMKLTRTVDDRSTADMYDSNAGASKSRYEAANGSASASKSTPTTGTNPRYKSARSSSSTKRASDPPKASFSAKRPSGDAPLGVERPGKRYKPADQRSTESMRGARQEFRGGYARERDPPRSRFSQNPQQQQPASRNGLPQGPKSRYQR
ncbi:Tho2p KNAG_0I02330 [Huiozyma naganishii CBS 8797]|uniref:THO complex subunit 2 n=1 Tax=Huiozyma naganishii (strain ATCC MYA-139 / BCRC 22969 / CBS 8797 / KCTC 17520 / NBRC 10181 / NCYC 3082 / Yp74L-3) TaxID=1071383 RepID=J7S9C8_HUIN7|nr:hypothetical protein KNAG_0I02330 [Kazachstania naganishii CBS 8797]CCK72019.1 hypothetical protein KNAG_0I02330 [Kazachstania naganishii CBS 8797]